jgi:hypothetical protein
MAEAGARQWWSKGPEFKTAAAAAVLNLSSGNSTAVVPFDAEA